MPETPIPRFCLECGREITDDFGFCPACGCVYERRSSHSSDSGNVRTGQEAQAGPSEEEQRAREAYAQYMNNYREQLMLNQLSMTTAMVGIWVAMAALMSLDLLLDDVPHLGSLSRFFGLGNEPSIEGIMVLVSGLCAVITVVLCKLRKNWAVALYSCLGASIVTLPLVYYGGFSCVYLFLFGLLASLRVRNLKGIFKS